MSPEAVLFQPHVIDAVTVPLMMLCSVGRVRHANPPATQLLAGRDGLMLIDGRLRTADPCRQVALDRFLGSATTEDRRGGLARDAMTLQRPSGRRDLVLRIVRRVAVDAIPEADRGAVLTVIDPRGRSVVPVAVLRQAFGLTGSEARVAAGMAEGQDLGRVADALGLTVDTARQYLQRVFRKTGTSRQGELVRLLTLLNTFQDREPLEAVLRSLIG